MQFSGGDTQVSPPIFFGARPCYGVPVVLLFSAALPSRFLTVIIKSRCGIEQNTALCRTEIRTYLLCHIADKLRYNPGARMRYSGGHPHRRQRATAISRLRKEEGQPGARALQQRQPDADA